MPDRIIAIGDIHGCANAFRVLLNAIEPSKSDVVVLLGDYIDRGSDSRGVLDLAIGLRDRCELVSLMGNHEELFLKAREDDAEMPSWLFNGGVATVASYGEDAGMDAIPPKHVAFMRNCRNFHQTDTHFFVHANYIPALPLAEQPEDVLRWRRLDTDTPARHCSGKIAIVGHTPQGNHEILDLGHLICIDTYCFGGGWLTALDTKSGKVWQANDHGTLRNREE